MQVAPTTLTVAEYCQQMREGVIVINHDYQRTNKVWPPAAKSFLIDTIIHGYPMPKLSLRQKTDVKSRKTIKEIVDGQQRSQAIYDFFNDKLRISGNNLCTGKRYTQIDEEDQQRFLNYQLTVDLYLGAVDTEIREVFRRINSYTVPLNPQEKRHAVYQGEFKWFIAEMSQEYAQVLKDIGVFSESQLSRMADAALLTELTISLLEGIFSASEKKLDEFYRLREEGFAEGPAIRRRLDRLVEVVIHWNEIHNGPLMRPYNFLCLALAVAHGQEPVDSLRSLCPDFAFAGSGSDASLMNLGLLAEALEPQADTGLAKQFAEFVDACSASTNRLRQRQTRFRFFCDALAGTLRR